MPCHEPSEAWIFGFSVISYPLDNSQKSNSPNTASSARENMLKFAKKKLYFSFSAHLSIKDSGLDFQKCAHWKEQDIVRLERTAPDTPARALKVGHLIRFPCPRMKIHFPEMHINIYIRGRKNWNPSLHYVTYRGFSTTRNISTRLLASSSKQQQISRRVHWQVNGTKKKYLGTFIGKYIIMARSLASTYYGTEIRKFAPSGFWTLPITWTKRHRIGLPWCTSSRRASSKLWIYWFRPAFDRQVGAGRTSRPAPNPTWPNLAQPAGRTQPVPPLVFAVF